jgi:hypothetical protein
LSRSDQHGAVIEASAQASLGYQLPTALPASAACVTLPSQGNANPAKSVAADISTKLETTIYRLLMTARTAQEFNSLRMDLFGSYINYSLTLANVLMLGEGLPTHRHSYLESIRETLAKSSDCLPWPVGGREEVDFCVETLYRAFNLLPEVQSVSAPIQKRIVDAELASKFFTDVFLALMHLSCLMYAVARRLQPSADVLREVITGMRSSVMAYSHIRQGVGLREQEDISDLSGDPL